MMMIVHSDTHSSEICVFV